MMPDEMAKTSHEINKAYKKTILEENEVVMALRGEVGLVRIIDKKLSGANITRGLARISADTSQIIPDFLLWELRSPPFRSDLIRRVGGSALQEISLSELRKVRTLIPPLPEQKKIAQILSTWDKAITITEKLLANSQQQKKTLMQQLLTGKKRLLDDNGARFSVEWKKGDLSDLGVITKGKSLSAKDIARGNYPVIAGGRKSPYTHNNFTHENIITISASGAYAGYASYHPYKLWASDCSVVSSRLDSDIVFIYFLIKNLQEKIYSLQSGGAQPHVYPKDLKVLKIDIPPLEEQQKIATVLSAADKNISILKQKLDMLKQEKKALMQQLLTGKRRVKVEEAA